MQFDWPDDTLFDKWMADIAFDEQWEEVEIDNDEMEQDDIKIIDTSSRDQREEKDINEKPIVVVGTEAQANDMIEEEVKIK